MNKKIWPVSYSWLLELGTPTITQRSAFYILLQLYLLVNNMHGKHASSLPYRTAFTASSNDNCSVLNEKTLLLSHLFLPLPWSSYDLPPASRFAPQHELLLNSYSANLYSSPHALMPAPPVPAPCNFHSAETWRLLIPWKIYCFLSVGVCALVSPERVR